MPSRDLYALKGLVCPQGICMPSRDLYDLKVLGPHGPGPYGPRARAQGAAGAAGRAAPWVRDLGPYGPGLWALLKPIGPKSFEGILVP